ncbi:hypothetical protein ACFOEK_07395 [Litoribrevibacter euphylliae]|uniref:N-acetyltransferase n=1 Tax=Litoribrevibacter euphylliae TaxID=1834034 RepID=A0ABV7HGN0_9GAMM
MQTSHSSTEAKYNQLRDLSLEVAQNNLPQGLKDLVDLKKIDLRAISQARRWEYSLSRSDDADWSWENGFRSYAYRHPKRFELAIWYAKAELCGLSIGKPTYSGAKLRLDVIEGAPWNHPLKRKVVELSVAAAEVYGDSIGAEQIRIMRPVNNQVIKYYQEFGFTLFNGKQSNTPTYLWRNL